MNFLKIAWEDISAIFKNRFIRVSVIAIIIVPLLYSLLYLYAFWDPYAKMSDMPVAVVNMDKGGAKEGKDVNYGKDLVDKLKENNKIGWRFVDYDEAKSGVDGKKYYGMFVIPKDFTENALTVQKKDLIRAKIEFISNDKKSFLAAQINGKVVSELKVEITKSMTKEIDKVLFDNLNEIKDKMQLAADGSKKLSDGNKELADKIPEMKDGVGKLADGSSQLKDGLATMNGKIPEMKDGVGKLADGSLQMANGINTTAVDKNGTPLGLKSGIGALASGLEDAKGKTKMLNDGASKLNTAAGQIGTGIETLNTAVNVGTASKPSLEKALTGINDGVIKRLSPGVKDLNDAVNVGGNGVPSLKAGITGIYGKVVQDPQGLCESVKALNIGVNVGTDATNPSLKDSLTSLNDGLAKTSDALASASEMLNDSVSSNDEEAKKIIANLSSQTKALKAGLNRVYVGVVEDPKGLSKGIEKLNTAVNIGTDAANPSLKAAIGLVYNGITKEDPIKPGLAAGVKALNDAVNVDIDAAHPSLTTAINGTYNSVVKDPNGLCAGVGRLNVAVNTGMGAQPSFLSGMKDLKDGTDKFVPGMTKAYDASNGLYNGASKLGDASSQIANGLGTLNSSIPALADGTNKLYDGSVQLNNGLGTLNGKMPELQDGTTKLKDGSKELSDKLADGSNQLNSKILNDSDTMSEFLSKPVEIHEKAINAVKTYGAGFAPYFISLSLWVGGMLMFFVVPVEVDDKIKAGSASIVLGKFLSFSIIGVIQAVLASSIVLTLGLQPTNMLLYFVFNILMSIVFIAIMQCLVFLVGDAGRLLSIVVLILQLTACAGTFPLEIVPTFFKVLNPFMPFTYTVEALREIISGTNYSIVTKDAGILVAVMAASIITSVLLKGHADKVQKAIKARKEAIA